MTDLIGVHGSAPREAPNHRRSMFTAVFLKANHGYVAFIEELPDITSYGETIEAARTALRQLAAVVFDAERENAHALVAGKEVMREAFVMPGAHDEAQGCVLYTRKVNDLKRRQKWRK